MERTFDICIQTVARQDERGSVDYLNLRSEKRVEIDIIERSKWEWLAL